MLHEREIGIEKVNKMFGTNITVKLSSSWEKIREEIKNELENQEVQGQESEDEKPEDKKDGDTDDTTKETD